MVVPCIEAASAADKVVDTAVDKAADTAAGTPVDIQVVAGRVDMVQPAAREFPGVQYCLCCYCYPLCIPFYQA